MGLIPCESVEVTLAAALGWANVISMLSSHSRRRILIFQNCLLFNHHTKCLALQSLFWWSIRLGTKKQPFIIAITNLFKLSIYKYIMLLY